MPEYAWSRYGAGPGTHKDHDVEAPTYDFRGPGDVHAGGILTQVL